MNEIIPQEKEVELKTKTNDLLSRVKTMEIKTEKNNSEMAIMLGEIKKAEKMVKDTLKPAKDAAKKAYDAVRDLEAGFLAPILEAREIASHKISEYVKIENERREKEQENLNKKSEVPIIMPKVSAPENVSYIDQWTAEVVDIKKVCKAVIDGILPPNAILPNMTILNGLARIQKENLNIPGIKAVKKIVIRNS